MFRIENLLKPNTNTVKQLYLEHNEETLYKSISGYILDFII